MRKILKIEEEKIKETIISAANCIKNGELVVFPTETVYGIGANALDGDAIKKIFIAKKRPQDNPLIVHISNLDMLNDIVDLEKISNLERKLIDNFFPGPLTIILPKKDNIPNIVSANLDTIGVRMPDNEIAIKLIEKSKVPIAAPSANVSSKPSGTNILDIYDELNDSVACFVDGGDTVLGIESTVVKVIENEIHILRPGIITKAMLLDVFNNNVKIVEKPFTETKKVEKVDSPGQKYKHYAPNTKCIMVYGDNETNVIQKIISLINENKSKYNNIAVMSFLENESFFEKLEDIKFINMGSKSNLLEATKSLYSNLRSLDRYKCDFCIIEGTKQDGLGSSIMNRLVKACEYNIFEV